MNKFFKAVLVMMILLLSLSTIVLADTKSDDEQLYFGVLVESLNFGKDFDGNHAILSQEGTFAVFLPELDSTEAIGFVFGGRKGKWAGEASVLYAETDAKISNHTSDARLYLLDLNAKYFFLENKKGFSPYVTAGVLIPRFKILKGGITDSDRFIDTSFNGLGANLGIGSEFKLSENFSLDASLLYRYAKFSKLKAMGQKYRFLKNDPCSDSFSVNVKATYGF